jgi:type III pantothenate kinase
MMILVVDIGNSNVVFGLFEKMECLHTWRTITMREESMPYYQVKLSAYFLESDIDASSIDCIVLSSVVPDLTEKFTTLLKGVKHSKFIVFNRKIYDRLKVSTSNPYEMGTDLMANAIAAREQSDKNVIIVDFGTALTFTLLLSSGEIGGVNIVPGIKTALKSLSANAAQLHAVPLEMPENIIGQTTVEAIQAGVIIGYQGLVKHMITEIKASLIDQETVTIATGGLSHVIPERTFDKVDKLLTLKGLAWIGNNLCLEN